ncbi:MAG TPA: toprim domain-containing protein [Gemmataceae bacterium]|nr:toprim domain-containing protein [Gemmataceae bacterium]
MTELDLAEIDRLTNGRHGTHDVPCPLCGPSKSRHGQGRKVMRIWRIELAFATYHCERCGESGYVRDRRARKPDPVRLAQVRAEAAERDRAHKAERLAKAAWLWSQHKPIAGTVAERYLRNRGYHGPLPATLGFLPATSKYPPAMIVAFGFAHEKEAGIVAISDDAVRGVHVTRLLPDGSGRERGDQAKIMIGQSIGAPMILAPPNDLLGLAIGEGIEKTLAAHEVTGLGAWAAGSASRMPALADMIPSYIDSVNIFADDDPDGRRHAAILAERLKIRGTEVRLIVPNRWRGAA